MLAMILWPREGIETYLRGVPGGSEQFLGPLHAQPTGLLLVMPSTRRWIIDESSSPRIDWSLGGLDPDKGASADGFARRRRRSDVTPVGMRSWHLCSSALLSGEEL